jgi:hypothetical protein
VLENINKTSRKAGKGGWLSRNILRFCLSPFEVVQKCTSLKVFKSSKIQLVLDSKVLLSPKQAAHLLIKNALKIGNE